MNFKFINKILPLKHDFIDKLEVHAKKIHEQLTHGKENLKIIYNQNVKTDFSKELLSRQDHDIFRHQTSVGPHRDDLQFFINEINVADFGSQGQQRTVALSIKLAEIDLIFEETGEYPILLLDDVMSELDNHRQLDLIETSLGKTQTFITTTTLDHLKNLPENLSIFHVNAGTIEQEQ
ncbi:DNA replication and repair protein RecF, partial [Lactococcus lactis]